MLTVIHPRWLIPIIPHCTVLESRALVLDQDRIIALPDSSEARRCYPAANHVSLPDHALLPGMVNLHGHTAMTLLRGLADDLALMDWLTQHIWPAEKRHVSDEFVFDGTLLGMAEMLRGGTTTINDMYFHHDAVARAALACGMRTTVGCSILEFPTPYAANADEYIKRALDARDAYLGEPLLQFAFAPHAPYTVSDDTFSRVLTLAEQLDSLIHCHIHETQDEVNGSLQQYGKRPLERLAGLGILGPRLIAAHMVHVTDDELATLARYNVQIAHNPASNLKLASGIAPVTSMLKAGINVGLGTDGAASNNQLDMLGDTRLAALLAKHQSSSPLALPAADALAMATINGARALGLADQIGSLEIGKLADMIAIDLGAPETQPCFDPVSHIVYAANRHQVSHVWVNGELLVKQGKLPKISLQQIVAKAHWWHERISHRQT